MAPGTLPFMILITAALLVWVYASVAALRFITRHKEPDQSVMMPFSGAALWWRFFFDGFGEAAEPARKRILRLYLLAIALFVVAVAVFIAFVELPEPE